MLSNTTWKPIVKSASVASVNRLFSIGIRLFTIPLLINYLGTERFGLWMTISAVSSYIMLLDMGIGSAMINRMTEFYARNQNDLANAFLTSILSFLSFIAIIGTLLTCLGTPIIDWPQLFKLTTVAAIRDVNLTVMFAITIFFLQIPFSLIQKIPYTMQKGYLSEIHTLLANIVSLAGMVLGVYIQAGLPFLVFFINGSLIFAPISIFIHLLVTEQVKIKFNGIGSVLTDIKIIQKKGLHFILMQSSGMLLVSLPFTMIAYFHGAAAVVPFGILFQALIALQIPLTVFLQPMWTKMTQLVIQNNNFEVKSLFNKYLKAALLYSVVTTLCFAFVLNPMLMQLLDEKVQTDFYLRLLFSVWCSLGLVCGGGVGAVILAMGLTSQISKISSIQLIVFIAAALILIPMRGAYGAVESIIASYTVVVPAVFYLIKSSLYRHVDCP